MASTPTIAFKREPIVSHLAAGANLTEKEGYAVKLSSGTWVLCDTQGERGFTLVAGAASGELVSVAVGPGVQAGFVVNAALSTVGTYLTPAVTTGKWEAAASADIATAITLEASTADGDTILGITIGPETVA